MSRLQLFLFCFAVFSNVLLTSRVIAQGGSLDLDFTENASSYSSAGIVAVQPDGKILIGGDFRDRVVRLNADGTEDPDFQLPDRPNSFLRRIDLLESGKILISGAFDRIGSFTSPGIVLLNSDGSIDESFVSPFIWGQEINDIEIQADGKILIGGYFQHTDSTGTRSYLARLLSDGSFDPDFAGLTNVDSIVYDIEIQQDEKILISGSFQTINSTPRPRLARLHPDGTLDDTYQPTTFGTITAGTITLDSSGKLLVSGSYRSEAASGNRDGIYRLDEDSTLDPTFDAGRFVPQEFGFIDVDPQGRIVVGGSFSSINRISRGNIARLSSTGILDPLFDTGDFFRQIYSMAMDGAGRVLVASYPGTVARLLAGGEEPPTSPAPTVSVVSDGAGVRLSWNEALREEAYKIQRSNGTIGLWETIAAPQGEMSLSYYDRDVSAGTVYFYRVAATNRYGDGPFSEPVTSTPLPGIWPGQTDLSLYPDGGRIAESRGPVILQPDGKLIADVKLALPILASEYWQICRFNSDGTLDTLFDARSRSSQGYPYLLQADGKLLVGGPVEVNEGSSSRSIARFNTDGTLDETFSWVTFNNFTRASAFAQQSDGKILVSGSFQTVDGIQRPNLVRLELDGQVDPSFGASGSPNGPISKISVDAEDRVLIFGNFTKVGEDDRRSFARLLPDGTTDGSFTAAPDGGNLVYSFVHTSNGKIYVGGNFSSFSGSPANRLVRLDANGNVDPSFAAVAGARSIRPMLSHADGSILIDVGANAILDGVAVNNIVRLDSQGELDLGFSANFDRSPLALSETADGKLYASGSAYLSDGSLQRSMVRLHNMPGVPPPSKVIGVSLEAPNSYQIRVCWSDVPTETRYIIERSEGLSEGWEVIGETGQNVTEFLDTGLTPETGYFYRIRSANASGTSAVSDALSTATKREPTAPATVNSRAYGDNRAIISWSPLGNFGTLYLQRSSSPEGPWNDIATLPASTSDFLDVGLLPDEAYHYRIVAVNNPDDTAESATTSVTPLPSGTALPGSSDPRFAVKTAEGIPLEDGSSSYILEILVQPDGKLILIGSFASYAGTPRQNILRIHEDGRLDQSFVTPEWGSILITRAVLMPEEKILVGGRFPDSNGSTYYGVRRIMSDGSIDPTFDATGTMLAGRYTDFVYGIRALEVNTAGEIFVGSRNIVKLLPDGTRDPDFTATLASDIFEPKIRSIALADDGQIYISGRFSKVSGIARYGFARLLPSGTIDSGFAPSQSSFNYPEFFIIVRGDGKVLCLDSASSSASVRLFRTDGIRDLSYHTPALDPNGALYTAALQSDGKLLVAGSFSTIGGLPYSNIARLNANGTVDATFDPGLSNRQPIGALAIGNEGDVFIAGSFNNSQPEGSLRIEKLLGHQVIWDTLQNWKIRYGLSPDAADSLDSDSDGLPLLVEYALGGNPGLAEPDLHPNSSFRDDRLSLTYQRLRNDVEYLVEASSDLLSWSASCVDQGAEGLETEASVDVADEPQQYLRLKVIRN